MEDTLSIRLTSCLNFKITVVRDFVLTYFLEYNELLLQSIVWIRYVDTRGAL